MSISKVTHLQLRNPLKTLEERKNFATFMAETMNRGAKKDLPRELNDGRNSGLEWQIDEGNDWFLMIDHDDQRLVTFNHRYSNVEVLNAMLVWAAYRWGGTVYYPTVGQ